MNQTRRKPKGSDGRVVRVGLVGPKPRTKVVGDGQQVKIPVPPNRSEAGTRQIPSAGKRIPVPSGVGSHRAVTADRKIRSDGKGRQEKQRSVEGWVPVPHTDTGRQVEDTKASERTLVKELGKMEP